MNTISIKNNTNNIIKKANILIEAQWLLSNTSQKMLAMLISMIRTDDSEFQKYALCINDFKKEIGATNKEVRFYVEQAKELMKNPFEIDNKVFNWCTSVDYGSIDGYLIFDIHNNLKPYLLKLKKNFTTYNIVNILSLRGDYTPRLYEYMFMNFNKYKRQYKKQYNKLPKSFTFELEINWLRDTFKIPHSYNYADIKRQIIEVAKKQFKEKTNIKFDYKEQKIGRKVVRLIITIKDNNKGSNDYLNSKQSFIKYIREKYQPNIANNEFPTILETTDGNIKIDIKGRLYLTTLGKIIDYDHNQSNKLWDKLYQMAQDGREF